MAPGPRRPRTGARNLRGQPTSKPHMLQRRFLLHSRWTSVRPLAPGGEQHFEIVTVSGERVTLRAVLTRRTHELTVGDLEDAEVWAPGWRSLRGA